jgi:hypothetical protein
MATLTEVADFLKTNMDFARFAKLVHALGSQVNEGQLRFLKAMIFEQSIEEYSNGNVDYVGQVGCDLIIASLNNARVEMKYIEDIIYTSKRKQLRETTGDIKLMNSMGSNTHKVLPANYADFLLCIGKQGAILFDKPTISRYIKPGGDGISVNLNISDGIILSTPDVMTGANQPQVDFITGLNTFIKMYIDSIK